ncbi:Aldehyde/histidinol dehydrogenase [Dactylonectria macrodidyma]|uniref:L-glutamate gamma-semialdehyde dehydrogenase n=1 Tax=Dactylonectria macrodidyma TaxID=307937 RepID=A0A9P9I9L8_9HYPO|nr:Aldehyde/histidinol dehydrogenase [Dactylonectria macrodidyma]
MLQFSYGTGSEERKHLTAALAEMERSLPVSSMANASIPAERAPRSTLRTETDVHWPSTTKLTETPSRKRPPLALSRRGRNGPTRFSERAGIYKRAARLVETKHRWQFMAATMIGQGKTCGQADGDCIAEVIDTFNFHVYFCHQMYQQQPPKQTDSAYSSLDYRPLEGFLLAISPFNFTALVLEGAGMSKGVIQFLPVADPKIVVEPALASRNFSGLHYIGSSAVLRSLASQIGVNTSNYKTFPRIVAAVRSAYEFQGQKCSALSRFFVPKSMWEQGDLKKALLTEAAKMTHGDDVKQLYHPLGPIVSQPAFERFGEFLERAQKPAILQDNQADTSAESDLMTRELFGPLFAVQTYNDASPTGFEDVCDLIDRTTEYGAVIGANPFGGARSSGTTDKANSVNVLLGSSSIRLPPRICSEIDSTTTTHAIGMAITSSGSESGSVYLATCVRVPPRNQARTEINQEHRHSNGFSIITMANSTSLTFALLGSGNLGTALAAGILNPIDKDSINVKRLIVTVGTEPSKRRVEEELSEHSSRLTVLLAQDNVQAAQEADVVLLTFKPVKREEVFAGPGIKDALRGKLVISIMAGISIKELNRLAPGGEENQTPLQVVRAMPNMAAKIRQAVTLYTADTDTLSQANQDIAAWVFNQVGEAQLIGESAFDISAVLVGCAGSLLLLAVDGLLDAAVAEGVKRPEATKMVVNSAIGMMKLVPAGDHPSVLREKIASPGGCSIRALLELEKLGVRSAFTSAILAAAERSKGTGMSRT